MVILIGSFLQFDSVGGINVSASVLYIGSPTHAYLRLWFTNCYSSSGFYLSPAGNQLTISGTISSSQGIIGGWKINTTQISSSGIILSSSYGMLGGTAKAISLAAILSQSGDVSFGNPTASYMKFDHSGLYISSSNIFLGSTTGAYISASGIQMTISSSTFYIDSASPKNQWVNNGIFWIDRRSINSLNIFIRCNSQ